MSITLETVSPIRVELLSKYSLDSIRYAWSISIGNETKNKAFAGVGRPSNSSV